MEIIEKNISENKNEFTLAPEAEISEPPPVKPIRKIVLTIITVFFTIAILSATGFFVYQKFFANKNVSIESPLGEGPSKSSTNNPNAVKEFASPINGVYHTKEEYEQFMSRRPLAIMVNNHIDARPQSGLTAADIVYEAVAEGGITRLMPIFHSTDAEKAGPVRSARVHFIDLAAEYFSWYAHWGGAYAPTFPDGTKDYSETNPKADAYQHINDVGLASLDQMWLGDTAYYRDTSRDVALEHTGYTGTPALWKEAPNKYPEEGWTKFIKFETWKFKDDSSPSGRGFVTDIKFNFWEEPNFEVVWKYNKDTNEYTRYQGGVKFIDAENQKDIVAKDVVVQFTKETSAEDKKNHLLYDIVGSGTAKIFMDGKVINATWSKSSIRERTFFYDESGKEMEFNRGQIWVEIIPTKSADSLSFVTQ
ncbi:MAG: DUF3048 domain-containing protein [Patescibacteria group bacterium]|nr:DUF3048 domain-containing protein [Patescibacteria group bacterium]